MTFGTLIVGTDFSACAETALQAVERLAPQLGFRRVHVVSVVQVSAWGTPPLVAGADLAEVAFEDVRSRLQSLTLDLPQVRLTREVRLGSPAQELAAVAHEQAADLIVTATHGRTGLTRAVLGSVTSALIRIAHVPVLVVPAGISPPSAYHRVLAAVDLSPVSRRIVEHAAQFARTANDGRIRVLSMFEHPLLGPSGEELLPHYASQQEVTEMAEQYELLVRSLVAESALLGVSVDIEVTSKAPSFRVILSHARSEGSDLVVVGTSGRNAWHRMIVGSTATRVLTEAGRPVLVVPHDVRQEAPEPAVRSMVGGTDLIPAGG